MSKRRRRNPTASGIDGEDIAVIGVAIFACYVIYDVVIKPIKDAECGVKNFLNQPSPLCPAFWTGGSGNSCPNQ